MAERTLEEDHSICSGDERPHRMRAVRDAMEILSGKWTIHIVGALRFGGKMRFMELLRNVDGIAAKMLSKELQNLEMNQLIKRTVCDTKPVTVEYEITDYGKTLDKIIMEVMEWGMEHRKTIIASGR
jgi:DNA-binding HxlR family transcriptional regulator